MVKIAALMVLKCNQDGSAPVILANESDISSFGFLQRLTLKELIVFAGRTVAERSPPGQRQSVKHQEYMVHSYNGDGLCSLGLMDDHYPVLDEYLKSFRDSWKTKTVQEDSTQQWPYLSEALGKFQDPAEADKLLKIQRELDETKIIIVSTRLLIETILERGQKLDALLEKSSDLSNASRLFYKQAKKTNQCCTIL